MKELITVIGGAGFIGTNLCQIFFDKGINFEIIDLKQSSRFPDKSKIGDVRDLKDLVKKIKGKIVFNLAAIHRDDVRDFSQYYRTNVQGAENVVAACKELLINKIIFTSSVAVYGNSKPDTDEEGVINPYSEYGRTKFLAEEVYRNWFSSTGGKLVIIRPTVIFGEGNRGNVFNLFSQINSGKFLMVGKGLNKKSMAYVGNIASFLASCLSIRDNYTLCNYVDKPDLDMNQLVKITKEMLFSRNNIRVRLPYIAALIVAKIFDAISASTKLKFPISEIRIKKFCSGSTFSSKQKAYKKFKPPFSLQSGIKRTLDYEFKNRNIVTEVFFTE